MLLRTTFIWSLTFGSCVHIAAAADPSPATAKLSDAKWLAGVWKNAADERMTFEEHWTAPAAGGMMGMFRLLANDKVLVYEYLLLEQEADGTYMRLRHYQPRMVDVDTAPVRCRLAEATPQKLIFENPDGDKPKRISYLLNEQQQLTVTVETTRDNKPATFTLRFQREAK